MSLQNGKHYHKLLKTRFIDYSLTVKIALLLYILKFVPAKCFIQTEVSLCDTNTNLGKFYIKEPNNCSKIPPEIIKICNTRVFAADATFTKIKGYKCKLLINRYYSTFYFFGSKTKSWTTPIILGADPDRCRNIAQTKNDRQLGQHKGSRYYKEKVFSTSHKLNV